MKLKNIAAALFLVQSLAAYGQAGEAFSSLSSLREAGSPVPAVSVPQAVAVPVNSPENTAPVKEWTVMIFVNGSNDLSSYARGDLRFIGETGPSSEVDITVEFSVLSGEGSAARRVRLLPPEGGEGQAEHYGSWDDRDMGDWRNLADFVRWSKAAFPARRYMLIIQNHGGGFVDQSYKPKAGNKGISYDQVSGNYIRTPELARVLAEAGPVDMLVMNACLMQTAEVAYELGPAAGVIVASEDYDRAVFFQYKERLEYLESHPGEETEKIAAAFVELRRRLLAPGNQVVYGYGASTATYTYTVTEDMANTLSAVDARRLADLPAALDKWTGAVMAAGEEEAVMSALTFSVRFGALTSEAANYSVFTDLRELVRHVDIRSKSSSAKEAAGELFACLDGLVVASAGMNTNLSWNYSRVAHGLAIGIVPYAREPQTYPGYEVVTDTKYSDLKLSRDSSWDEFLAWAGRLYYRR